MSYQGWKVWLNSEDTGLPMNAFPETRQLREYVTDPTPTTGHPGPGRGSLPREQCRHGWNLLGRRGRGLGHLSSWLRHEGRGRKAGQWHACYPEEWKAQEAAMKSYRKNIGSVARWMRAKVVNRHAGVRSGYIPEGYFGARDGEEGFMPDVVVSLVTPTRDRPEAFNLCVHWMSRQTYRQLGPIQWVVVDDGDRPVDQALLERARSWGWTIDYIRRAPTSKTLHASGQSARRA